MASEDIRSKYILLLHMSQLMAAQVLCLVAVFVALKHKSKSKRCQMSSKITKYRKRVTLDGFNKVEEFHPFASPEGPSGSHSHGTTSFKSKKRARKVMEDDISMVHIAKSIEKMAFDSLSKSITELINQNENDVPENVISAQLEEIGVEPSLLPRVYMHLVQNPVDLKAFHGIPIDKRKEMLPHIVPGYLPSI